MVLMCMSTWLPPTMPRTQQRCNKPVSRSGSHQRQRWRPELHARRFGLGEIPRRVHLVQTIPGKFRSRGAKTDRGIAKSLGRGFVNFWRGTHGDTMEFVGYGCNRVFGFLQQLHGRALKPAFSPRICCTSRRTRLVGARLLDRVRRLNSYIRGFVRSFGKNSRAAEAWPLVECPGLRV